MSIRLLQRGLVACAQPGLKAMVGAVLYRECETDIGSTELERTAQALQTRILEMPAHLSVGMLGLTALFDFSGLVQGQRSSEKSTEDCAAWMNAWRSAPLGPARDFVLFYDKMAAFAFHSIEEDS